MNRLSGRRIVVLAVFAFLFYVLIAYTLPRALLICVLNGVFVGMALSLSVTLMPLLWRAIRDKAFDAISQLTMGIVLTWLAVILLRVNNIWGRHANKVGPGGNNFVIPLGCYLSIIGAIFFMTTPGMIDRTTPRGRIGAIVNLVAGLVIALASIVYQLDGVHR